MVFDIHDIFYMLLSIVIKYWISVHIGHLAYILFYRLQRDLDVSV